MNKTRFHSVDEKQRSEIIEKIRAVLIDNPHVAFAFLHGSFLSGPFSRDIDLGIFVTDVDPSLYWDFECSLADCVENVLHASFAVEPKVINSAPLPFRFHVIRGMLLCVRDEDFLTDFMVRTAKDYFDIAPLRQRHISEAIT